MNPDAARALARDLIHEHLDDTDWTFKFDNAKRRIGQCRHDLRRITLSRPLVEINSDEEVLDTILHEIAHAQVGVEHDHDAVWREAARRLGCVPKAAAANVVLPPKPWTAICTGCARSWGYYRRMSRLAHCGAPLAWERRPKNLPDSG